MQIHIHIHVHRHEDNQADIKAIINELNAIKSKIDVKKQQLAKAVAEAILIKKF